MGMQISKGLGGSKGVHVSKSFDSDKKASLLEADRSLALVSIKPTSNGWNKVQKKKGKQCG